MLLNLWRCFAGYHLRQVKRAASPEACRQKATVERSVGRCLMAGRGQTSEARLGCGLYEKCLLGITPQRPEEDRDGWSKAHRWFVSFHLTHKGKQTGVSWSQGETIHYPAGDLRNKSPSRSFMRTPATCREQGNLPQGLSCGLPRPVGTRRFFLEGPSHRLPRPP